MTVKANMPTLSSQLKRPPWKDVRSFSYVTKDHGRRARRTLKATLSPECVNFERAAQVAELCCTVPRKGGRRPSRSPASSPARRPPTPPPSPPGCRATGRPRTAYYVRDVTYQEDKFLVRVGNAPRMMAALRSAAISVLRLDGHDNIAEPNRHHARAPQRTLKLLQAA